MKAYVITTGVVFGVLTLVHLLQIIVEGHSRWIRYMFSSALLQQVYVFGPGACLGSRDDRDTGLL